MHTIHNISSEKYRHKFVKKKSYGYNLHDTKTSVVKKYKKKSMKEILIKIYIPKTTLIICLKQRNNWTKKGGGGDLIWRGDRYVGPFSSGILPGIHSSVSDRTHAQWNQSK